MLRISMDPRVTVQERFWTSGPIFLLRKDNPTFWCYVRSLVLDEHPSTMKIPNPAINGYLVELWRNIWREIIKWSLWVYSPHMMYGGYRSDDQIDKRWWGKSYESSSFTWLDTSTFFTILESLIITKIVIHDIFIVCPSVSTEWKDTRDRKERERADERRIWVVDWYICARAKQNESHDSSESGMMNMRRPYRVGHLWGFLEKAKT